MSQRALCSFCKQHEWTKRCDYPFGESYSDPRCDAKICDRCATHTDGELDLCPTHARFAGVWENPND